MDAVPLYFMRSWPCASGGCQFHVRFQPSTLNTDTLFFRSKKPLLMVALLLLALVSIAAVRPSFDLRRSHTDSASPIKLGACIAAAIIVLRDPFQYERSLLQEPLTYGHRAPCSHPPGADLSSFVI